MTAISPEFNDAVRYIVSVHMPYGFDTTADGTEVDTFDKVLNHFNNTGRIKVWSGASDKSIFDNETTNHAFRAWHDYIHIIHGYPFTYEGELDVMRMQQYDIDSLLYDKYTTKQLALFKLLVEAEVKGQIEYFNRYDYFPINQKAFALEYLQGRM